MNAGGLTINPGETFGIYIFQTDGGSNIRADETIQEAIADKIGGIHIIVAAVGRDLNVAELRGLRLLFISHVQASDSKYYNY